MLTTHKVYYQNALKLGKLPERSIDLLITSPPYPMIQMWDDIFCAHNRKIEKTLHAGKGFDCFELMHRDLDIIWEKAADAMKPGGIVCINIGDATRTLNGCFALYPNHARIITAFLKLGFNPLPDILWRKQTNAPNKFMGSGMLPPGAYVTLEHEYILIMRKGNKREFPAPSQKEQRRQSAYFWEERNLWFSDVWMDLKGARQRLTDKCLRERSGAYPFELPYRLIQMFSTYGDTVLDPFMGTGTTMAAAMASCRNSIGYEIEPNFKPSLRSWREMIVDIGNERIKKRIKAHTKFVIERLKTKANFKYQNKNYGFPVITRQEQTLCFKELLQCRNCDDNSCEIVYADRPDRQNFNDWEDFSSTPCMDSTPAFKTHKKHKRHLQLSIFDQPGGK